MSAAVLEELRLTALWDIPQPRDSLQELPLTVGLGTCSPLGSSSDLLEWGLQFLPVVQGVLAKKGEAETLCSSFEALESPGVTALG